jgi:hypothetical protein
MASPFDAAWALLKGMEMPDPIPLETEMPGDVARLQGAPPHSAFQTNVRSGELDPQAAQFRENLPNTFPLARFMGPGKPSITRYVPRQVEPIGIDIDHRRGSEFAPVRGPPTRQGIAHRRGGKAWRDLSQSQPAAHGSMQHALDAARGSHPWDVLARRLNRVRWEGHTPGGHQYKPANPGWGLDTTK